MTGEAKAERTDRHQDHEQADLCRRHRLDGLIATGCRSVYVDGVNLIEVVGGQKLVDPVTILDLQSLFQPPDRGVSERARDTAHLVPAVDRKT